MSAHSRWLQFVTELPDSPKTKAKGVVLVRGPWHATLGSIRLLFLYESIPLVPRSVLVLM